MLIGVNHNEDDICQTLATVMEFWEIPEESQYIKSRMGDIIGLIKSGQDQEIAALVSEFSDGWVKWDAENDEAGVNVDTVSKNLLKIPQKMYNVQGDIVKGYRAVQSLGSLNLYDSGLETALDYGKKIGNFMDFVADASNFQDWTKSNNVRSLNSSKIIGYFKYVYDFVNLYKAYQVNEQNQIKAYLKIYTENRPAFDSADDMTFQLMMDAHAVSSGLSQEKVNELEQTAEQLYLLYKKFGGGLSDAYKITIRCPVDVMVYDSDGKLVGRVVDNVVDYSLTNALQITVGGENQDEKTIYVQDNEDYHIELIGNDVGSMQVDVQYDDTGATKTFTYNDIALTDGKRMQMSVSSDTLNIEQDKPAIVTIENGIETSEKEEVDNIDTRYSLTIYSCLEQKDGTVISSTIGGYAIDNKALAGQDISTFIHTNTGYLFENFYEDVTCNTLLTNTIMPAQPMVVYAKFKSENTNNDLSYAEISFDEQSSTVYTGKTQIPQITVKLEGEYVPEEAYSISYICNGANVENACNAGIYDIVITANDGSGYVGNCTIEKAWQITPAVLTPELHGEFSKVYDGTKICSENTVSIILNGILNDDTVTAQAASYTYDNAYVGTNKQVFVEGITLIGDDAKNYTLVFDSVKTTGSITYGFKWTVDKTNSTITLSGDIPDGCSVWLTQYNERTLQWLKILDSLPSGFQTIDVPNADSEIMLILLDKQYKPQADMIDLMLE